MILLGKDIVGKTIVEAENDEEKAEVKDLLIEKNRPNIAYLTFELEKPAEQMASGEQKHKAAETMVSGGGRSPTVRGQLTPGMVVADGSPSVKMEKVTFLIPREQIERITANAVMMKGTEREQADENAEIFSYTLLKDFEVETEDGEKLGKIKDIVVEELEKKVVGLKLSEGFWEKLTGDGTKYMPYGGVVKWSGDKLIVESSLKEQLVDQFEELL